MGFLRAQQRSITGLFPHQANKTHLMPNSRAGPEKISDVYAITTVTLTYDEEVTGGDDTGWQVFHDGVATAITTVLNGITDDIIIITHALAVVGQDVIVRYTPKAGAPQWRGVTSGILLKRQTFRGVVA